jgi:hypothetical protein
MIITNCYQTKLMYFGLLSSCLTGLLIAMIKCSLILVSEALIY